MAAAQIKFKILGKTWRMKLHFNLKKFEKKHGHTCALTWSTRLIEVGPRGFDLETIRHELVHAYQKEMCLGSVNEMTPEDVEEWIAELVGRRIDELLALADHLYTRMQQEIQRENSGSGT